MPSIFTLASLFLGFLAILQSIKGNFQTAVYLLTASVILDGFDGAVARLTKTESNFGVQLDSLVDAVSFGVVSAVLVYMWGFNATPYAQLGKVAAFVFLSAGIIRLARFNVLKEAETYVANVFVGLPIPLAALSVGSVILLRKEHILAQPYEYAVFILYIVLLSFLMVSNVKYRTMKRLTSRYNLLILLFMAAVVALGINFPTYTIPAISLTYLASPLFFAVADKFKKPKESKKPGNGIKEQEPEPEPNGEDEKEIE